jgi:hypothetical protein
MGFKRGASQTTEPDAQRDRGGASHAGLLFITSIIRGSGITRYAYEGLVKLRAKK